MKITSKILSIFIVIITFIALASCQSTESNDDLWADAIYCEDTTLGEGEKTVKVTVSADETQIVFTINTDADTLAEALLDNLLVEGEDSQYGIYIKKVNGMLADYDIDGYYWSLTQNGEYLMTGADSTPISNGDEYELTRTK